MAFFSDYTVQPHTFADFKPFHFQTGFFTAFCNQPSCGYFYIPMTKPIRQGHFKLVHHPYQHLIITGYIPKNQPSARTEASFYAVEK